MPEAELAEACILIGLELGVWPASKVIAPGLPSGAGARLKLHGETQGETGADVEDSKL